MNYLIWNIEVPAGCCVCMGLGGFDESFKITNGLPVAEAFPQEAYFEMSPDFPKDIELADNVNNWGNVLISKRLKEALEQAVDNRVEYLPVKIINHKGRVASEEYFVVNTLDFCDAIDMEQSDVVWNSINPDILSVCYKLVLDEERIPAEYTLFRLTHFPTKVLVRRDVADRLKAEGFTGLRFIEIEDYDGFE